MNTFNFYAHYYDILYRDKNYDNETHFISRLLKSYVPQCHSILELGSGTGLHAVLLSLQGYNIVGVDRSDEMIMHSNRRIDLIGVEDAPQLRFVKGDIRDIRLGMSFDVVISLFHVISYQSTNNDLLATFTTARTHLKLGGYFIFDCWYAPAVLTLQPVTRVKYVEDENTRIIRVAEPKLHPNDNFVDVHYRVFVQDKTSEIMTEIQETHRMRYLSLPEIDMLFAQTGFERVKCGEWLSERDPGSDTWGIYVIGRVKGAE